MAPVIYRGLLTERIARQLEHDIRSGEIQVGTKLPSERELAAQLGASRNVVREALRRLEARHLIEVAYVPVNRLQDRTIHAW